MAARPIPGPHKLTPEILVRAYAAGVFPMSESVDDPTIFWVDPQLRGVIPLEGLHISKSLRKVLRRGAFEVTVDQDFPAVIKGCAQPRRPHPDDDLDDQPSGTWINAEIMLAYIKMAEIGLAHSVECWQHGELVGGLYGISLKGAFMGESMFSTRPNASKVALAHLVARLRLGGFTLLDTQFLTDHLATMGGIEISGFEYQERLQQALSIDAHFPLSVSPGILSSELEALFLQPCTQTS